MITRNLNTNRIRECLDFVLNRLLIIFFFCLLLVYASREIVDLDLWLHLKTGEYIALHKLVPAHDIFSFTIFAKPWINHEWLFQLISYLLYSAGGAEGLIYMQNAVLIAAFLLIFITFRRKDNHIPIFIIFYLTLLASAYRFTIRPDIFSIFFVVLYLCIIKNFIEKRTEFTHLALILFASQAAWSNIHGFSFAGPLIVLVFLISELLKRFIKLPASLNSIKRIDDKELLQLILLLGLLVAACFINPYGIKGFTYPFSVLGQITGKGGMIFKYIVELAKPIALKNIFDLNRFVFYKAFIIISLFSFRFNQRNINISDILFWFLFLCFSLIAVRNIAYFAFVACFITFNNIELAYEHNKTLPSIFNNKKIRIAFRYILIACLFYYPAKGVQKYVEGATFNYDSYKLKSTMLGISENRFPKKGAEFLLQHKFPAEMFNDFNSGAYLIGRTYPQRRVFIDGRTELYGADFFENYVDTCNGKNESIEKTVGKYAIKGFFLTTSTKDLHTMLIRYLLKSKTWKVVYFDDSAVIFLKDIPENRDIIKNHAVDLKNFSSPEPQYLRLGINRRYPYPYINRARFLYKHEYYESAAREAGTILKIMPDNGEAYKFIADYYYQTKDYDRAFINIRNSLIFSPGDLSSYAILALIYEKLGKMDSAIKIIDSAINKNPRFSDGLYTKALLLKKVDTSAAKSLLGQALKLSPENPQYHIELGDILYSEGDVNGAREEWERAYEYDAFNDSLKEKLALN